MAKNKKAAQQAAQHEEHEAQQAQTGKNKNRKGNAPLPVLLEVVYSFSLVLIIVLAALVAVLSFVSGAKWLDIFMRTAVTILSSGILMWIFSSLVSQGASQTLKALQQEAHNGASSNNYKKKSKDTASTDADMDAKLSED